MRKFFCSDGRIIEQRMRNELVLGFPLMLLFVAVCLVNPVSSIGPLAVFPGAVGFGTATQAGRGGKIIKVTNLNDSGTGSLRAAVDATGPRIVVFEVSGRIDLRSNLTIKNPYITIAGQTAPPPGIMITGRTFVIQSHDILIQHLSVRVGDEGKVADGSWDATDAIRVYGSNAYNIVIDHVSASWSIDEILDVGYGVRDLTINNSIFAQPLYKSVHTKGAHGYGNLLADNIARVSSIGNLFASSAERLPRIQGVAILLANNVYFNKGGGDFSGIGSSDAKLPSYITAVGNLFLEGPSGVRGTALKELSTSIQPGSAIYQRDNAYPGGTVFSGSHAVNSPPANTWIDGFTYMSDPTVSVKESVIRKAGARPAARDVVDEGVIAELTNGTGRIIDSQAEVGGFPSLAKNVRVFDAGTNPNGDDDGDGYTNVEEILHQMAAQAEGK